MIGLSSSYFGCLGKKVYDSAKSVFDLGFDLVELGAAHGPEPGVWGEVKRVKKDFSDKNFTIHGLFPPQKKGFWFNSSFGLTAQNKQVLDGLFKAASLVEATTVSIHPGFSSDVDWKESSDGICEPLPIRDLDIEEALPKFYGVVEYGSRLAEDVGCVFAIENISGTFGGTILPTADSFEKLFGRFPDLKMLFDFGHALSIENVDELLPRLVSKVGQVHMHFSEAISKGGKPDGHLPITSISQLEKLKCIKQFKGIPVIFEHGSGVFVEQILDEKRILEEFEKGF